MYFEANRASKQTLTNCKQTLTQLQRQTNPQFRDFSSPFSVIDKTLIEKIDQKWTRI